MYMPERLHAVRIAAKKLRYALELAADSGARAAVPLVRTIKRAQDMLGRLHDLQILQSHVAAVQAAPGAHRPGMHVALEALARHIEDECRHLHGKYVGSAAALRALCQTIAEKVVPQMEKPRTRRVVKMKFPRRQAPDAAADRR
jgi:CHAD domain-containing protein